MASVLAGFVPVIEKAMPAVSNITTGGGPSMSLKERLRAAVHLKPELCSLNMGSMTFAFFPAAKRISNWKYEWERDYVEGS